MKLSFSGVSKLRLDYREWLNGSTTAGYEPFRRDLITFGTSCSRTLLVCSTNREMCSDTLLLKTHADEYRWAEPDAYSESAISLYSCLVLFLIPTSFERGLATGDSNVASENLRRFFEQHFHEGSDSSVSPLLDFVYSFSQGQGFHVAVCDNMPC
jgi:anaphase-promoting complex subunit 5